MKKFEYLKNLEVPTKKVDCVLDTDAYNEIDDQFAIAYILRSSDKLNLKAIFAAPFFNEKSSSPKDGMEKSYDEIFKVLDLSKKPELKPFVYKGSTDYLKDEKTPQVSEAAKKLVELASNYSKENPLYVIAIAAITNVASALLLDKSIAEKIVIVWLGGNSLEWCDNREFNAVQDIAATRVIYKSKAPLVQVPCWGIVTGFSISEPELTKWLVGKNPLADYLAKNTIEYEEQNRPNMPWAKPIWDVCAVGYLLDENERFMQSKIIKAPQMNYQGNYCKNPCGKPIKYVYYINRNELFSDLFNKLSKGEKEI